MPNGRFISHGLGDSEKFAGLANELHRVAYMLVVTWSDEQGRFAADAVSLRGKLYTRLPWTADQVEAALQDMARVGLIHLYRVAGKRYGLVDQWHEHQKIQRDQNGKPKREGESRLPPPPQELHSNCDSAATAAAAPLHIEVEVEGKGQVQGKETSPPTPPPENHALADDEDDDRQIITEALTAADRRRDRNHSTGLLAQQHPHTHAGLQDLQGVYRLAPPQYSIYAAKLLELARDHGDTITAAAVEAVVLSAERIKQPLPYIRKIITNHAAEAARLGTTEVGAIDFKGDLERLFGAN